MKRILIVSIILLLYLLSFCIINLYENSKIINKQKKLIKELTPKFNGQDTLDLLKLCLNLKEFDYDTKLLDTSKRITILMYPYITREYSLYKYRKKVWVANSNSHPYDNQFMFSPFKLYNDDTAYINFIFNDYRIGIVDAKKINGKWEITKYIIGRK